MLPPSVSLLRVRSPTHPTAMNKSRSVTLGLGWGGQKMAHERDNWETIRIVRVALGTGYNPGEGNRLASRGLPTPTPSPVRRHVPLLRLSPGGQGLYNVHRVVAHPTNPPLLRGGGTARPVADGSICGCSRLEHCQDPRDQSGRVRLLSAAYAQPVWWARSETLTTSSKPPTYTTAIRPVVVWARC